MLEKMFERKVTAAPRRDRSVFCKVTSPKTSEIEEHFTFSKKNTPDLLIRKLTSEGEFRLLHTWRAFAQFTKNQTNEPNMQSASLMIPRIRFYHNTQIHY